MVKQLLCLIIALFFGLKSNAQYKDVDNPFLNGFYLGVNFGINNKSLLGGGLDLRTYLLQGRVCIDGRFNVNVLKNSSVKRLNTAFAEPGIYPIAYPINGLDNLSDKELGACYNFSRRSALTRRIFLIGTSNMGTTRIRTLTFADATVLWMLGGRAGFGSNKSFIRDSIIGSHNGFISTIPNILQDTLGKDAMVFYTNFSNVYSYFGFQFTRVFNVLLNDGRRVSHLDIYADVLLPLDKSIKNLSINDNGSEFVVNTTLKSQANTFGYRIGFKSRAVRYLHPSYTFEVGKMPGYNFTLAQGVRRSETQYGKTYLKLCVGFNITAPVMTTDSRDFN